jgi:hypothetical protein
VVEIVATLLRDAFRRLEVTGGTPSDILILVPFAKAKKNKPWKEVAVDACAKVQHDYIDYTDRSLRRATYSPNDVRIATFHSSRGIEACHSIVLGFECLSGAGKEQDLVAANLGYIALTRSLFETDVLYHCPVGTTNSDVGFLEGLLALTGF